MNEATKGISGPVHAIQFRGGPRIVCFTGTINTATTYANTNNARPGTLLLDATGLKLYINTGTKASPTWTVVGAQS
jgi:hypothetical protein